MTDERITPKEERRIIIQMLDEIDPEANYPKKLEEEVIDAYDTTIRIKAHPPVLFSEYSGSSGL